MSLAHSPQIYIFFNDELIKIWCFQFIKGRYEEATEYFSKAYNIARSMSDLESINTNRVQYGIAMAHKMLKGLSEHIVMGTRPALERLCEWKDARTDDFKKPFPEPSMSKNY